ncbi:MAG: phosphatase PAP2 family protein [Prevotella sp.]|jgi:membrane-associated phospholipid phosphatase|nr:phosphatase PAP2 family protein [Prevotella sp.]MCR5152441.1 phosphatase PAP2 family protein [Prevotella sp.]
MKLKTIILLMMLPVAVMAQDKSYRGDGIDDYLQYAPWAGVVALKVAGVDGASNWKRFVVNAAASYVLMAGTSYTLKHTIHERRPDGTDDRAFPSGHAAVSFAGAHVLHKEYGKVSPWISVGGYAVATFTAIDRVYRHRHKWHDVAAGAAIGIGATELGYWLGDKITGERSRYRVSVSSDGLSLAVQL